MVDDDILSHIDTTAWDKAKIDDGNFLVLEDDFTVTIKENKKTAPNGVDSVPRSGAVGDSFPNNMVTQPNGTVKSNERKSTRMSPETKAALADYKSQRDAVAKAQKAVYEAERKQMVKFYKERLSNLEASYSSEVEDMMEACAF